MGRARRRAVRRRAGSGPRRDVRLPLYNPQGAHRVTEPRLPRPNPQVLFTELDDGTGVLLHLDTKFYFTLNPSAVIVWKSLAEPTSGPSAIAERITKLFRVDHETAARDVDNVLGEMLEDGLVLPA
ncbi:PqqD family peptide modification chaperone [Polyangium spumosum]|uniref:PqqD family peptide modification chaperone n=1 Tax=Polyangium spumosum TaxID=889282 RepID=A0A6N7Q0A9_9BACT|nr:PqqD family peptide modification chaperone [Polyangium spumosum]